MNKNLEITLLVGLGLVFAGLFLWQYVLMIYEVTYKLSAEELYLDNETILIIEAVPLNSFGNSAPFRDAPSDFFIDEGNELVEIIEDDNKKGIIKIKALNAPGKVVVTVKSKYSLFPTTFIIPIYSNNT